MFCVIEVTKEATRTVLTNQAYLGQRYRGTGFSVIAKYDRREVVESTTFEKVRKVGHGRWVVIDKDGLGVKVSESWVLNETTIPLICYNDAKDKFKRADNTPVIIPPGSCSCLLLETVSDNLPPVVYRNMAGEHKCLENCFISAMHFIGFPEIGKRIKDRSELAETQETSSDGGFFLQNVANTVLIQYDMKLVKNNKLNRYDPIAIAASNNIGRKSKGTKIVVAKLRGRNGGINHAVCFVNDELIFDANRPFALPFTEESLELVCDGAGYRSLYWSFRMVGKGIASLEVCKDEESF